MSKTQTALKARHESLPRCLRHAFSDSALKDAISIVKAINILSMAVNDNDWFDAKDAMRGVEHVTKLLLDKLEIAAGIYKFPMSGTSNDPALAERVEDEE